MDTSPLVRIRDEFDISKFEIYNHNSNWHIVFCLRKNRLHIQSPDLDELVQKAYWYCVLYTISPAQIDSMIDTAIEEYDYAGGHCVFTTTGMQIALENHFDHTKTNMFSKAQITELLEKHQKIVRLQDGDSWYRLPLVYKKWTN